MRWPPALALSLAGILLSTGCGGAHHIPLGVATTPSSIAANRSSAVARSRGSSGIASAGTSAAPPTSRTLPVARFLTTPAVSLHSVPFPSFPRSWEWQAVAFGGTASGRVAVSLQGGVIGSPASGHGVLVWTSDAGKTWRPSPLPRRRTCPAGYGATALAWAGPDLYAAGSYGRLDILSAGHWSRLLGPQVGCFAGQAPTSNGLAVSSSGRWIVSVRMPLIAGGESWVLTGNAGRIQHRISAWRASLVSIQPGGPDLAFGGAYPPHGHPAPNPSPHWYQSMTGAVWKEIPAASTSAVLSSGRLYAIHRGVRGPVLESSQNLGKTWITKVRLPDAATTLGGGPGVLQVLYRHRTYVSFDHGQRWYPVSLGGSNTVVSLAVMRGTLWVEVWTGRGNELLSTSMP